MYMKYLRYFLPHLQMLTNTPSTYLVTAWFQIWSPARSRVCSKSQNLPQLRFVKKAGFETKMDMKSTKFLPFGLKMATSILVIFFVRIQPKAWEIQIVENLSRSSRKHMFPKNTKNEKCHNSTHIRAQNFLTGSPSRIFRVLQELVTFT